MPAEPPNVLMAPPMLPRLPSRFNPLPADDASDSGEAPAALGITVLAIAPADGPTTP